MSIFLWHHRSYAVEVAKLIGVNFMQTSIYCNAKNDSI